jgi:hypothetical protein
LAKQVASLADDLFDEFIGEQAEGWTHVSPFQQFNPLLPETARLWPDLGSPPGRRLLA